MNVVAQARQKMRCTSKLLMISYSAESQTFFWLSCFPAIITPTYPTNHKSVHRLTNETYCDTLLATVNKKGEKMVEKMRTLLKYLNTLENFNCDKYTAYNLANRMLKLQSRATTYRHLKLAEKCGYISYRQMPKHREPHLTDKGHNFLGAWNELPF